MELKDKRLCTSKTFKKGEKGVECGTELLMVMATDGREGAWICPDCDALEWLPKSMRSRILEQ